MSFRIAMSGVNAALIGLRTAANNIANANTAGFQPSRTEFAERIADGTGRGVRIAQITREDSLKEVDLAEQLLDMIKFSQQIEAQSVVMRTERENVESIMDAIDKRESR